MAGKRAATRLGQLDLPRFIREASDHCWAFIAESIGAGLLKLAEVDGRPVGDSDELMYLIEHVYTLALVDALSITLPATSDGRATGVRLAAGTKRFPWPRPDMQQLLDRMSDRREGTKLGAQRALDASQGRCRGVVDLSSIICLGGKDRGAEQSEDVRNN